MSGRDSLGELGEREVWGNWENEKFGDWEGRTGKFGDRKNGCKGEISGG